MTEQADEWPDHWGDDPSFWGMIRTVDAMGSLELRAMVHLAELTIATLERQIVRLT